jgi:transposase-like protein
MTAYLFDEPRFHDPEVAREHLEAIRWPDGPVCPHCGACDRIGKLNGKAHRRGVYECGHCRDQFTVTVGTVFERSKVSLDKWLFAATLMMSSKKGVSSKQIERMVGVTYKTAWFMTHRLREAMKPNSNGLLGSLGGTVEADETFIGRKPGTKVRRGHGHKEAVFSLVERAGHVRSFHVNDVTAGTLKWKLAENVSYSATLMTDDARQYTEIGKYFAGHQSVNHSAEEYVRGDAEHDRGVLFDLQAWNVRGVSALQCTATLPNLTSVITIAKSLGLTTRCARVAQRNQREAPYLSAS